MNFQTFHHLRKTGKQTAVSRCFGIITRSPSGKVDRIKPLSGLIFLVGILRGYRNITRYRNIKKLAEKDQKFFRAASRRDLCSCARSSLVCAWSLIF